MRFCISTSMLSASMAVIYFDISEYSYGHLTTCFEMEPGKEAVIKTVIRSCYSAAT